jgi:peptidoglycan/LPS O-acetylase OafA/YrhL
MGFLRFFLATMVLVSHMGITLGGLNPGVTSVVVFYLLAGHVVCQLWLKRRQSETGSGGSRLLWFYRDRFWRIAPLYYFALLVALAAWLLGPETYFLSAAPSAGDWLSNASVLPLNYYMFNQADTFTLIPPAWSLAVELQFYLLMPFLLRHPAWLALALGASLLVFALAQSQWLHTDIYGYRLLPGVAFIFICGAYLRMNGPGQRLTVLIIWGAMALYVLSLFAVWPELRAPYNTEVALGFVLGVPAVYWLSGVTFSPWLYRLQSRFGLLSYGVFLLHFPVLWLLSELAPGLEESVWAVLTGSVLLALAGHYGVEKPVWRRFRQIL